MIPEFALVSLVGIGVGAIAGCILYYYIGTPKCEHQWEKIIDASETNRDGRITGYVVVHMCKKCGKRKITKV